MVYLLDYHGLHNYLSPKRIVIGFSLITSIPCPSLLLLLPSNNYATRPPSTLLNLTVRPYAPTPPFFFLSVSLFWVLGGLISFFLSSLQSILSHIQHVVYWQSFFFHLVLFRSMFSLTHHKLVSMFHVIQLQLHTPNSPLCYLLMLVKKDISGLLFFLLYLLVLGFGFCAIHSRRTPHTNVPFLTYNIHQTDFTSSFLSFLPSRFKLKFKLMALSPFLLTLFSLMMMSGLMELGFHLIS